MKQGVRVNVKMLLTWALVVGFVHLLPLKINGQNSDKQKVEAQLLKQARENIEKYRKGDALLTFTDAQGKPLKDVKIEINQQTQDFLFGNLGEKMFNPRLTAEEVKNFRSGLRHCSTLLN